MKRYHSLARRIADNRPRRPICGALPRLIGAPS